MTMQTRSSTASTPVVLLSKIRITVPAPSQPKPQRQTSSTVICPDGIGRSMRYCRSNSTSNASFKNIPPRKRQVVPRQTTSNIHPLPPPPKSQPARQFDQTVGRFDTRPKISSVRQYGVGSVLVSSSMVRDKKAGSWRKAILGAGSVTVRWARLPMNRSRRRESARILCLESKQVRRLTSAATRFRGSPLSFFRMHWHHEPPLTRPPATLSPSDGEREGVRGRFMGRQHLQSSHCGHAALRQTRERPFVFRDELVHDVPVLQLGRQNFPGVGLHLDVRTKRRVLFQNVHHAEEVIGSVVKQWRRF